MKRPSWGTLHMTRRIAPGRVRRLEAGAAGLAHVAPRWPVCGCCAGLGLAGGPDAGEPTDGPWRPVGKALVLSEAGGRSYGTCYGCGATILAEIARDRSGGWEARGAVRAALPV